MQPTCHFNETESTGQPLADLIGLCDIDGVTPFIYVLNITFFVNHERGPVREAPLWVQNAVKPGNFPFEIAE